MNIINGNVVGGDLIINGNNMSSSSSYVQGSGNVITKDVTHLLKSANLKELVSSGIFEVMIHVNPKNQPALIVEAEDNIIPLINFQMKNDSLNLKMKESISNCEKIQIILSIQSLNKIELSGLGRVTGIIFNDSLKIKNSGSGQINLSGIVHDLDIKLSGNGSLNLSDLYSNNTHAIISGMGNVNAIATNTFSGEISGMGNITVDGNPNQFDASKSGMGHFINTKKSVTLIKESVFDINDYIDIEKLPKEKKENTTKEEETKPQLSKKNVLDNIKKVSDPEKEDDFLTKLTKKLRSLM